ncbi:MAG: TIGR00730 family Rossman fold protein [Candidatus Nomurabacteria bacterium]|jgi:uncharacterized protein (TIGR00730 family)|nr:TIGR00730 family Rossman fold protein [Candidatus Nomurabacteria bacterium]
MDQKQYHSRREYQGQRKNPFTTASPAGASRSLEEIAADADKHDPLARLRALNEQKSRDERFRTLKRPEPKPVQLKTWDDTAYEFGLSGSDYFQSMRYAKDLNRGLKILEIIKKGVTIFGSRFGSEGDQQYDQARLLGRLLAKSGHTVISGGGPGIMEAVNRGAYEIGGHSVGLKITLPGMDEPPNPYVTEEVTFEYFFARKAMLINAARAFVFFPGGYGTLDEFTEVLVLQQEHKMLPAPIYLVGVDYFRPLHEYFRDYTDARGFLTPGDLELYTITDDVNVVAAGIAEHTSKQVL